MRVFLIYFMSCHADNNIKTTLPGQRLTVVMYVHDQSWMFCCTLLNGKGGISTIPPGLVKPFLISFLLLQMGPSEFAEYVI